MWFREPYSDKDSGTIYPGMSKDEQIKKLKDDIVKLKKRLEDNRYACIAEASYWTSRVSGLENLIVDFNLNVLYKEREAILNRREKKNAQSGS